MQPSHSSISSQSSVSPGVMMEFAQRNVVCVEESAPLSEVIELMNGNHIGSVIVVDNKDGARKPVGIVTDRDIALSLLDRNESIDRTAGECMSKSVAVARISDDVFTIIETFKNQGVGRLPLVDDQGELVGIVSSKNLLQKLIQGVNDLIFVTDDQQKQNELFTQRH